MVVLQNFHQVHWPPLVTSSLASISALPFFNLGLFDELLPLECLGLPGFYSRLVASVCLPLASALVLLVLTLAAAMYISTCDSRRHRSKDVPGDSQGRRRTEFCTAWKAVIASHHFWNLAIWALLVMYPSVSRKSLATFNAATLCRSPDGSSSCTLYLAEDTSEVVGSARWAPFAVIAIVSLLVFSVGIPLVFLVVTQRLKGAPKSRRVRFGLWIGSYRPNCEYFEAVEMLRKLLLTGGDSFGALEATTHAHTCIDARSGELGGPPATLLLGFTCVGLCCPASACFSLKSNASTNTQQIALLRVWQACFS
jgi:hypothetical protein